MFSSTFNVISMIFGLLFGQCANRRHLASQVIMQRFGIVSQRVLQQHKRSGTRRDERARRRQAYQKIKDVNRLFKKYHHNTSFLV